MGYLLFTTYAFVNIMFFCIQTYGYRYVKYSIVHFQLNCKLNDEEFIEINIRLAVIIFIERYFSDWVPYSLLIFF